MTFTTAPCVFNQQGRPGPTCKVPCCGISATIGTTAKFSAIDSSSSDFDQIPSLLVSSKLPAGRHAPGRGRLIASSLTLPLPVSRIRVRGHAGIEAPPTPQLDRILDVYGKAVIILYIGRERERETRHRLRLPARHTQPRPNAICSPTTCMHALVVPNKTPNLLSTVESGRSDHASASSFRVDQLTAVLRIA